MQLPLQIHFDNLEPSDAVESRVRKYTEKLERFCDEIISCRVTIEAPHKHHHQGNICHVTVDVRTPGDESVASRAPAQHHAHEDVYVAVRDAFDAVQRQLQDHQLRKRGKVKSHETPSHGKITELYPAGDKGPQASTVHLIGKHHIVG